MEKPKFQVITLSITSASQRVKIDESSKLLHKHVKGVAFKVSDDVAVKASEVELSVDGEEILPEGFEVCLLNKYNELSLHETKHEFTEKAENSSVKGEYKDSGAAGISYPYTVKIYLFTTQEENE